MTDASGNNTIDPSAATIACPSLDAAIAHYTEQLGYRLDMIMPADAPRVALVSRDGITLRLEASASTDEPASPLERGTSWTASHADDRVRWCEGRAGMRYRDLIPGRLGGRAIASLIRIPDGGPVPDYVHWHQVGFQMIYCRRGWVRVVYEDQGPAFVMQPGDCVLQPPTIRHRVLECSDGLEVVEIGCPAEHATWRDHEIGLPTPELHPQRLFGGQRFVRHVAEEAAWRRSGNRCVAFRDTGIHAATNGLATVHVVRIDHQDDSRIELRDIAMSSRDDDHVFLYVLDGKLGMHSAMVGEQTLAADDACTVSIRIDHALRMMGPCEILVAVLPAG